MAGSFRPKGRDSMVRLVLAFVLVGPVNCSTNRPVVGIPFRAVTGIVDTRPVRGAVRVPAGIVRRVGRARPVRRVLQNRRPVRSIVNSVFSSCQSCQ